jgi:hypothetical protein
MLPTIPSGMRNTATEFEIRWLSKPGS